MKVLYLYMFPLWGNGSGAWLRRLVYQLKKKNGRDFDAYIIAPERRKLKFVKIKALKPPITGVFVGNPELPKAEKYSEIPTQEHIKIFNYYLLQSAKIVEKFKPDVIHAFHTAFLPPVARSLHNFYRVPFVISTHGSDLYYFEEDARWKSLMRDASVRAKYIIANSSFTRHWYLKMFGKDLTRRLRTIPAGIDSDINFSRKTGWIDKKYNFKHSKMVLFTGRLTEHKGVDYLIKAARKIKAEIVILGDGPERKYLERLIKKYKLNNVHMLGYFSQRLEKLNDFYLRADIYVAPSVWAEPLGMVILEAMVHKTPVIVTRKGGVTTIVKDGHNGYLVRAKSSKKIVEKVNHLLEKDKLREKMGERAYKTVVKRFSWDKIATRFYNLYSRTMKKRKKK